MAVRKGNTALLNKLNAFIQGVKQSGKLDEIVSRYAA